MIFCGLAHADKIDRCHTDNKYGWMSAMIVVMIMVKDSSDLINIKCQFQMWRLLHSEFLAHLKSTKTGPAFCIRSCEKYQICRYYNKYVDCGTMGWGMAVISLCHSSAPTVIKDLSTNHRSFFSPISILSIANFAYHWIKKI